MLRDPVTVQIEASVPAKTVSHALYPVPDILKKSLLMAILKQTPRGRVMVFTRTKHKAQRLSQQLSKIGISADSIHSNKTQSARQRALDAFDRGHIKVLVATDIVARGIDVDGITHVINYELPNEPESYVHRIGRTARAGADGIALSFCDSNELPLLGGIQRFTKSELPAMEDHPFHSSGIAMLRSLYSGTPKPAAPAARGHRRPSGRRPARRRVANWQR